MNKWRITYKGTLIGWLYAETVEAARQKFAELNPWHDENLAVIEKE